VVKESVRDERSGVFEVISEGGNGTVDGDTDETCDDSNSTSGDDCSVECQSE